MASLLPSPSLSWSPRRAATEASGPQASIALCEGSGEKEEGRDDPRDPQAPPSPGADMERPLSSLHHASFVDFFWTFTGHPGTGTRGRMPWDASTTSHSDIRGLSRLPGTEPSWLYFVGRGRSLRTGIQAARTALTDSPIAHFSKSYPTVIRPVSVSVSVGAGSALSSSY